MATDVVRNQEAGRYEVVVDGRVGGWADYRVDGGTVVLPHTVVEPARRGQGLAGILIGGALDDIARSGRQVVPACSYVADFIRRHPEYEPMVAGPGE